MPYAEYDLSLPDALTFIILFVPISSNEIEGMTCGFIKLVIACDTSRSVSFPICWPMASLSFLTPKYSSQLPCLFSIETIDITPSFSSSVDFLNSIFSVFFPIFIVIPPPWCFYYTLFQFYYQVIIKFLLSFYTLFNDQKKK